MNAQETMFRNPEPMTLDTRTPVQPAPREAGDLEYDSWFANSQAGALEYDSWFSTPR